MTGGSDWRDPVSEKDASRVCRALLDAYGVPWRLSSGRWSRFFGTPRYIEVDVGDGWGRPYVFPKWKAFLGSAAPHASRRSVSPFCSVFYEPTRRSQPISRRACLAAEAVLSAGSLEELELRTAIARKSVP